MTAKSVYTDSVMTMSYNDDNESKQCVSILTSTG
jgi:hypothetical protein